MEAALIFLDRRGEDVMIKVFGEDLQMNYSRLGTVFCYMKILKNMFDKFLVVIVPVRKNDLKGWKLRVLDKSILPQEVYGEGISWKELDNKELIFKGNTRPAARYLYYHYVIVG